MSDEQVTAIEPIRQESVLFYGDELVAAQARDGSIYVPMRPLVEGIGLVWRAQRRRINDDPSLSKHAKNVRVETAGGSQEMLALPLKIIPGWLFKVQSTRLKPELREKIERYQDECYDVLWRAFQADIMQGVPTSTTVLTAAEVALQQAEAVANLARQQVEFERKQTIMAEYMRTHVRQVHQKLRDHTDQLSGVDTRLSAIELRVGPAATLDEAQAREIMRLVSQVAVARGKLDGGNHYGEVYNTLHDTFMVTSYKNIPAARFVDAVNWLSEQLTAAEHAADSG